MFQAIVYISNRTTKRLKYQLYRYDMMNTVIVSDWLWRNKENFKELKLKNRVSKHWTKDYYDSD